MLDLAGFIPGIGDVADAINAIGYALEGDWVNAGISAASVVGADWLKAGRLAKRVVQEVVEEGAEQVAKREAKNALQQQGKKQADRKNRSKPSARPKVPEEAKETLEYLKTHNWAPPRGYKGGRVFQNREGKLPACGNYREYDIHPYVKGQNRGTERIVVDINTGRAWYTPDHYETFIEIKK
ncbi:MAG: hypothetical protein KatS3mg023_1321 [Armatimonadota bacterium]|nr:MAG: hypothetical protein KatS3mg023_1321 [Armatimonadota bacterium]